MIVNGANYYPEDIEQVAEVAHPAIRIGSIAAVSIGGLDSEALGIIAEVRTDDRAEMEAAAAALRETVTRAIGIGPELIAFIPRRSLPKTSSGKVRRRAALEGLLDKSLQTCAVFEWKGPGRDQTPEPERDEAADEKRNGLAGLAAEEREQVLTAMVIEAIGVINPAAAESAGPDTSVAQLGLDSVDVAELLAEMEDRSGAILPLEQLVPRVTTIREFARAVSEALDAQAEEAARQARAAGSAPPPSD